MPAFLRVLFLGIAAGAFSQVQGQDALWIWSGGTAPGGPGTRWFRREFRTPPLNWNARLTVAAEASAEVFLNGKRIATCQGWDRPVRAEVSMNLNQGENVLAVRVLGGRERGALLVHLNLGGNETRQVVSDTTWKVAVQEQPGWTALGFDASKWSPAASLGPHGVAPWGDVLFQAEATPAAALKLLPGFQAELLRSAGRDEGSWICLAFDEKGRVYLSPEGNGKGLIRCTLDPQGGISRVDPVPAPIRSTMGLLFAHGSLYANARGPSTTGLHRLIDTNGNDQFDVDEVQLLQEFKGGGEHGYHGLALGPDQKVYILNGNGTKLPEGIAPESPYRNYAEDILSLNPDETTRAGGALVPGCQILRTDAEGRDWELVAGGMRNAYGFDFNADGELFAYDSDNEWDWGTPWYRSTRIFHCVSGAEMGWRDGTRAWPDHYPDAVPGVVDIGIGSPTGVKFGTRSRFPEPYRSALFVQDWSYGRILAVHLEPHGATYRGRVEEFVRGQPLNLTSLAFGPDGAMYFTTGGRGTQSGLYRVRYGDATGQRAPSERSPASSRPLDEAAKARAVRHQLEALQGRRSADALDTLWTYLGHPDAALRFAARLALESQQVSSWEARALGETNATAALTGLLALARVGGRDSQPGVFRALERFPMMALTEEDRLSKLRVIQLSLIRHGRPSPDVVNALLEESSARFPSSSWPENREQVRLLTWLEAPATVSRTLDLMGRARSQEEQIHYVSQLRNVRGPWSPEDRRRYFTWWTEPRDTLQHPAALLLWFQEAGRAYVDGAALDRHLEGFRRDAIAALPDPEREALKALLERPIAAAHVVASQPRPFVQAWTMADILPVLDRVSTGRNFERGRRAFIDAQCYACHRFGNAGGGSGPELTAVGSKYGPRDLLEALLEPSKIISDQFQNLRVTLKDGEDALGRLVRQSEQEVVLEIDPLLATEQVIPRARVIEIKPSTVSPMPEGLLDALTRDEVLDLVAFLAGGGRPDGQAFTSPAGGAPR